MKRKHFYTFAAGWIFLLCALTACGGKTFAMTGLAAQVSLHINDVQQENYNVYVDDTGFVLDMHSVLGTNYVDLHTLARALNGTEKQFSFEWNDFVNATVLIPDTPYTATEYTDIAIDKTGEIRMVPVPLFIGLLRIDLLAIHIDGKDYFRLRDIGQIIGFTVSWDSANRVIRINTSGPPGSIPVAEGVRETPLSDTSNNPLDSWIISLDGTRQLMPLNGVYRNGRMYVDAARFTLALGLPMAERVEKHLFELTEEYGLLAYFNRRNGTIELFSGHERPERLPPVNGNRDAFMRLEDVIARGITHHDETLFRRRAIADLLYSHNAAFTIAWVPVNVRPSEGFRNDTRDYSRYNMEFVFTMDYWISRGGQMGLHGYTHQRGNENSVAGHEFGTGVSNAAARELFQLQVDAAHYFGWTPYSFTFPKYVGTRSHFEIAGEYFDFIMPNFDSRGSNTPHRVRIGGREVVYMNAVEDHMVDQGEAHLAALLNRLNRAGNIASFYFHTWLDYEYIQISRDGENRPVIHYSTDSPLHRILNNLRENGRVLRPTTHFFSQ